MKIAALALGALALAEGADEAGAPAWTLAQVQLDASTVLAAGLALPSPPFLRGRQGLMPGAIGVLARSTSGYPRHPGSYKIRAGVRGMGPELPAGG